MLRVLSLGAGVQSTTMALMASRGEIKPMPDCAIFADTGDEPAAVYAHLEWLGSGVLPFPLHVVSRGILHEAAMKGEDAGRIPFYEKKSGAPARRQCTKTFKLSPIRRKCRELLGVGPNARIPAGTVETWLGISTDEVFRITPSKVAYVANRYPLIEQRMSRGDCLEWIKRNGYPQPPKSACVFCPYQSNRQWRDLKESDPNGWAKAVGIDHWLRSPLGVAIYHGELFVHRSRVPLNEVDLSTSEDRGQLNLFNNECEGMCGV